MQTTMTSSIYQNSTYRQRFIEGITYCLEIVRADDRILDDDRGMDIDDDYTQSLSAEKYVD
jgi:hypothetical protein